MSPSLTSIYTGMTSIISMLIYRRIRPVNRIRTSTGMRSSFMRTGIIRTCIIAISISAGTKTEFVDSKALNSVMKCLIFLKECLSLLTFGPGVFG
jgi:hypothetical protein